MHHLLPFFTGFVLYSIICRLSYVNFNNFPSIPFIIAGLAGALGNVCWMYIAQTSITHKEILVKGLMWDIMITSIYLFIPLLLLDIQGLSLYNRIGIGLVFLGIILVKI